LVDGFELLCYVQIDVRKRDVSMTLNFAGLTEQVERMGRALGQRRRTLAEHAKAARQKLIKWSDRLEEVKEYVERAGTDFRGAAPLDEAMAASHPPPPCPNAATLIAVDGSQIYPDQRASTPYYLTNIGVFVFHHGTDRAPELGVHPELFYQDEFIYAKGQPISNPVVNARRTKLEMEHLASAAWERRGQARPLLAVADGPLLFWVGSEVPQRERDDFIMPGYYSALARLRGIGNEVDGGAALVGYVDKPASTYVIRLLHLLTLAESEVNNDALTTSGKLEGLKDRAVFGSKEPLLASGERSALFVQQSPYNARYREHDADLEIAFFYLNAALPGEAPYLARVEMPMWVARDRGLVGQAHALLYHQCQLYGRYPYILVRADELAAVLPHEKRELDNMIEVTLGRQGAELEEASVKAAGKSDVWRAPRGRHRL
jgi:hypothetical protein